MALITTTDFTNKYKVTLTDFNATELTSYIERYETITLVELFGVELYDLWIAGIGLSDPLYTVLRDPFIEQLDCGIILNSRGVNDMLLGVVYFYWQRDRSTQRTDSGPVKKKAENSESVSHFKANLQSRWDEAIDTYCAIQKYIMENDADYPEFNGLRKEKLPIY